MYYFTLLNFNHCILQNTTYFVKNTILIFFVHLILFEPFFSIFCDSAKEKQIGFQEPATYFMHALIEFHGDLVFFLILICVFVFCLLFSIFDSFSEIEYSTLRLRFSFDKNSYNIFNLSHILVIDYFPYFVHSTLLELIWTICPALLLFLIILPSFSLLYSMDELIRSNTTLFVIGNQWYWSYELKNFLPYDELFNQISITSECSTSNNTDVTTIINYYEKDSKKWYKLYNEDGTPIALDDVIGFCKKNSWCFYKIYLDSCFHKTLAKNYYCFYKIVQDTIKNSRDSGTKPGSGTSAIELNDLTPTYFDGFQYKYFLSDIIYKNPSLSFLTRYECNNCILLMNEELYYYKVHANNCEFFSLATFFDILNIVDTNKPFSIDFDSYMINEDDLHFGGYRLLETDQRLIIPKDTIIRVLVTSSDVLHSWAIPSFGIKIDACPGRLNQINFFCKRSGVFYGQCSEICGINHAFMPIVITVIPKDLYFDDLAYLNANVVSYTIGLTLNDGPLMPGSEFPLNYNATHKSIDAESCPLVDNTAKTDSVVKVSSEDIITCLTSNLSPDDIVKCLKGDLKPENIDDIAIVLDMMPENNYNVITISSDNICFTSNFSPEDIAKCLKNNFNIVHDDTIVYGTSENVNFNIKEEEEVNKKNEITT